MPQTASDFGIFPVHTVHASFGNTELALKYKLLRKSPVGNKPKYCNRKNIIIVMRMIQGKMYSSTILLCHLVNRIAGMLKKMSKLWLWPLFHLRFPPLMKETYYQINALDNSVCFSIYMWSSSLRICNSTSYSNRNKCRGDKKISFVFSMWLLLLNYLNNFYKNGIQDILNENWITMIEWQLLKVAHFFKTFL